MTDERDRSGYPNQPYAGEPERGEGGMRDRDSNGRDPHRQGFGDQDQGMHRGPRRSRYGRRRMPGDAPNSGPNNGPNSGPNDYQADHREQRGPRSADDDVDNYLPSFIAGSSGAPDPFANPGPGHGQQQHNQPYNSGHNPQASQSYQNPPRDQGYQGHSREQGYQNPPREQGYQNQPREQGYQNQPRDQGHQGHPRDHGGYQGGGYAGDRQPPPHGEPSMNQGMPQVVQQPEEPSPEVQAAAAEFAAWEASNPKLRGLLICNPTFKRAEPVVRGTRIPARILAAIAKMGSSVEEMLQDYPALSREGLDAALAFAAAHPRQSR